MSERVRGSCRPSSSVLNHLVSEETHLEALRYMTYGPASAAIALPSIASATGLGSEKRNSTAGTAGGATRTSRGQHSLPPSLPPSLTFASAPALTHRRR